MTALKGFTIVELAEGVAGEYCGKLLADFGAGVVKIERPGVGSPTRHLGPLAANGPDGERSGLFAYLNTNKQSVALDVGNDIGRAALRRLIDRADVVIDDHPAGWLASVGLDPAAVEKSHPRLVLASITPYGQSPLEDRLHAEDLNVLHSSGLGYHTPSAADETLPPLKGPGRFLASYEAGLESATCIVAALHDREASQRGQFIDVSKQAVLASRVDYVLAQMVAGDMDASPKRTAFDLWGPAGIFPCRDGFVYIWMSAPSHWDALRKLLGAPAWMDSFPPHWLEKECTPERVATVRLHLTEWLSTRGKSEAAAAAQKLGLTVAEVNDPGDVAASEQYSFRGFFAEVDHPVLGRVRHPTVPYRLSETPATIERSAPALGEHTKERLHG